jgi:SAM-dependent methyltransferase
VSLRERVVHDLAGRPIVFDVLRWLLEAGYRGERGVLRRERCAESGLVLDLGCGTGALAGEFRPDGYVGIDPDPRYVVHARRKHPRHRFAVMDGTRLGFGAATFDTVVISGVLHHLDDETAVAILAETRRVLRPSGGQLVAWEDVPTRSPLNVLGRVVHRLDEGDRIRPQHEYLDLVRAVFPRATDYPMRSGVCDYVVMVAPARAR